ncbi:hypothetical protein EZV62_022291 [Acer yangbiense]|uniref:Zinc knuckle CX2CX4HX4C domain-containing protein n=1 Tax=Acer yangbiense TaxID=1000413 RepID=A0A5C7H9A9_9ROSI|nr:hypothetical protein EZV62_022291 [Acer yangbiense]
MMKTLGSTLRVSWCRRLNNLYVELWGKLTEDLTAVEENIAVDENVEEEINATNLAIFDDNVADFVDGNTELLEIEKDVLNLVVTMIGQVFNNEEHFKEVLQDYVIQEGFKMDRSSSWLLSFLYEMSAVHISQLYEGLSLADEDEAVCEIAEEVIQYEVDNVDKCLVGKVLSGKKVNIDAFKDRNWVWHRGPWHFGKSLIVLEKLEVSGNISKLGFNRADFWVQIHDIPIMCMNRRTARWLAEQIREVVEIFSESRECWGKYMRVKVKLDIYKPLKRWLRLKLGKYEKVTMVGLKYERLSEFYFTYGRIGHGNKECLDEEARKAALEGLLTKFGFWLIATIFEKFQNRSNSQTNKSSSERGKSLEGSRETEGDGSLIRRSNFLAPQKSDSGSLSMAAKTIGKELQQDNLITIETGSSKVDEMCVDGLGSGSVSCSRVLCLPNSEPISGPINSCEIQEDPDPVSLQIGVRPIKEENFIEVDSVVKPRQQEISNTLLLNVCKSNRKISKGSNSSTSTAKGTTPARKGKSPMKTQPSSILSLDNQPHKKSSQNQEEGLGCKRKVVFDLMEKDTRDQKKRKEYNSGIRKMDIGGAC